MVELVEKRVSLAVVRRLLICGGRQIIAPQAARPVPSGSSSVPGAMSDYAGQPIVSPGRHEQAHGPACNEAIDGAQAGVWRIGWRNSGTEFHAVVLQGDRRIRKGARFGVSQGS